MTEPTKLEPCPFCGEKLESEEYLSSVSCANCGAIGPDTDCSLDAIAAWNRRSPTAHRDERIRHLAMAEAFEEAAEAIGRTGVIRKKQWREILHQKAAAEREKAGEGA